MKWLTIIFTMLILIGATHASLVATYNNGTWTISEVLPNSTTLGYGDSIVLQSNTVTITNVTNASSFMQNSETGSSTITAPPNNYPPHKTEFVVNGQATVDINNVTVISPSIVNISKTFTPTNAIQTYSDNPIQNVSVAITVEPIAQSNTIVQLTFNQSKKDNVSGVTYKAPDYPLWDYTTTLNCTSSTQTITYNGLNETFEACPEPSGTYNVVAGNSIVIPNTTIKVFGIWPNLNETVNLTLGEHWTLGSIGLQVNAPGPNSILDNISDQESLVSSLAGKNCTSGSIVPFYDYRTNLNVSMCSQPLGYVNDSPFYLDLFSSYIFNHTILGLGQAWVQSFEVADKGDLTWHENYTSLKNSSTVQEAQLLAAENQWHSNDTRDNNFYDRFGLLAGLFLAACLVIGTAFLIQRSRNSNQVRREKQEEED